MKKVGALIIKAGLLYTPWKVGNVMPAAYKITSDPFFVNGNVTETAPDTFTTQEISLPLDSLNQEGILVHGVYFTGSDPDRIANLSSFLDFQLTATRKIAIVGANDANLIGYQQKVTTGGAAEFSGPHIIEMIGSQSPYQLMDNLMLVATDNLFLSIKGLNQTGVSAVQVRVVCSRVKLTASAYAALVTNELSS
jgi:hypothetical protein